METQAVSLLLVDDDEIDCELIIRSLRKVNVANPVLIAVDGEEALAILRGANGSPGLARPYIVILDWNMPRMNGGEFLDELRKDDQLKDDVVFVLTTPSSKAGIAAVHKEAISGYIVKDRAGTDFVRLVETIDTFWRVVEQPSEC